MRRVDHLLSATTLVAATVWLARPWSWRGDCVFPQRDTAFSIVALHHLQAVLLLDADWRVSPLGWPFADSVTHTDWMLGQALIGLPLRGIDPQRAYQLLVLAGLLLTAWACHLLARLLLGPGPHTALAGVIGGLSAVQLVRVPHVNLVHHEWAILAALGLGVGVARDRPGIAALGGACVGIAFHFGAYMGLHALLVAGITALALVGKGTRRSWLAAAGGALVSGLTVIPVAIVYHNAQQTWHMHLSEGELGQGIWRPWLLFRTTADAPLHEWLGSPAMPVSRDAVAGRVGFVAAGLTGLGLSLALRRRPRWPWIAAASIGAITMALASLPSPVDSLRSPDRWLGVTWPALGLFAALALERLSRRLPRPVAWVVGLGVIALVVAEQPPTRCVARSPTPPVYASLPSTPGPLLEVFRGHCDCAGAPRLIAALGHGHPLVGGNFARFFHAGQALNRLASRWPAAESVALLHALGVGLVLEHPPVQHRVPKGWRCDEVGDHRLCTSPVDAWPADADLSTVGAGPTLGFRWDPPPQARHADLRGPHRVLPRGGHACARSHP